MTVHLLVRETPDIPVETDTVTPSHFFKAGAKKIAALPVQQGNQTRELGDFFEIKGQLGDSVDSTEIQVSGDLRKFKMLGRGMKGGRLEIVGDAGMYVGAEMVAGRIHVTGSVGSWAGAEMQGGNVQIEGDAGDCLCASYRGSLEGMKGGRVYVAGDAGREMASHMRRGFIAVKGSVGDHAAAKMQGGTIVVLGALQQRFGISATRGMLIVLGKVESLLPTYRYSGTADREFVPYYLNYLRSRRPDFIPGAVEATEKWIKFMGDFAEGRPYVEVYARTAQNTHLLQER
jgi:formylmethanofuran dehydrogenase subunit C